MMNQLETRKLGCPYCGETIEVLLDGSEPEQSYIEDCQVCCRPINFHLSMGEGGDLTVLLTDENA